MTSKFSRITLVACLLTSATAIPLHATEVCEISSNPETYYPLREESILLLQYGDVVIRAADGTIRCEEDPSNRRQVCLVDGQGVILTEGGDREPFIIELKTEEMGEVHVYEDANLSCGLKSEFDKYR